MTIRLKPVLSSPEGQAARGWGWDRIVSWSTLGCEGRRGRLRQVWPGRRISVLDDRAQPEDLPQYLPKIPCLMLGRVRVVVAHPFPEVAAGLVETAAQNPRTGLDIGAEIVAQGFVRISDRRVPMRRDVGQPDLVDLDRADVHRSVRVRADAAKRAAFDIEQDHQHGRR